MCQIFYTALILICNDFGDGRYEAHVREGMGDLGEFY